MSGIRDLDGIEKINNLHNLFLSQNFTLENIEKLKECNNLRTLYIHHNEKYKTYNNFPKLNLLENLAIHGGLSDFENIKHSKKLKRLHIDYIENEQISKLQFLQEFHDLMEVKIGDDKENYDLSHLPSLKIKPLRYNFHRDGWPNWSVLPEYENIWELGSYEVMQHVIAANGGKSPWEDKI